MSSSPAVANGTVQLVLRPIISMKRINTLSFEVYFFTLWNRWHCCIGRVYNLVKSVWYQSQVLILQDVSDSWPWLALHDSSCKCNHHHQWGIYEINAALSKAVLVLALAEGSSLI